MKDDVAALLHEEEQAACVHGVPEGMECVHCLMAYCDEELRRVWQYARFLEKFLETLLGPDWNRLTLEDVQQIPNLPLEVKHVQPSDPGRPGQSPA